MQHPKSKDVRKIVALLTSVLPLAKAKRHLDMGCTKINGDRHKCGTVHCHGGWFGVALKLHLHGEVSFTDGADEMGEMLGFAGMWPLNDWVKNNPKIWGVFIGDDHIFSASAAKFFHHPTKRPNGAKNLQHIIDHWTEVAERLEVLENQVAISDPPITAEELIESLEPVIA